MNNTFSSAQKSGLELLGVQSIRESVSTRRPLLFAHSKEAVRDVALSRIAAEVIAEGGRVLWATSNASASPLAWAKVSTASFDMADVASLPRIAPFSLDMVYASRWLAYALGAETRLTRSRLARAVGQVFAEGGAETYDEGLSALREYYNAYMHSDESSSLDGGELMWDRDTHRAAADRSDEDYGTHQLTVFSGSREDFSMSGDAFALAVLSLISEVELYGLPYPILIILDDVIDALSPRQRELLRTALLDHAANPMGMSLITVSEPALWEYDDALVSLLASGVPMLTPTFTGNWPLAWGESRPQIMAGMDEKAMIAIPSSRMKAGDEGYSWRWLHVPSPVVAPISGIAVMDVEHDE